MKLLILTTLVACATAAPSILAPYPYALPVVSGVLPAVAPTIPPGDIEAAAIDAQVKIADQARVLGDEVKDIAEQAVEKQNQDVIEANDLANEKSEEALWAAEEKKWQALNEAQIAVAKLAGTIASRVVPEAEITEAKADIKNEVTEIKSEEKSELKSDTTETKLEDTVEVKSEATELKNEENLEVKAVEAEKPTEIATPAESIKQDGLEVKTVASEMAKLEEALTALKSAYAKAGFNYQPYLAPKSIPYPVYYGYPVQQLPAFPYQPLLAVKKIL